MHVAGEIFPLQRKIKNTCSLNSHCTRGEKAVFSWYRKVTSQARMEASSSPTLQQLPLCMFSLQQTPGATSSKGIQLPNFHDVSPDSSIPVLLTTHFQPDPQTPRDYFPEVCDQ